MNENNSVIEAGAAAESVSKPFGANDFIERRGSECGRYWYKDIREMTTLKDLLNGSVERYSERAAFWVKAERGGEYLPISYELLAHDVEALGTMLLQLVDDERRVAVIGEGSYEWIASYLATMNSGMVVVPIDKDLSGDEIKNLLDAANCHTVVCSAECAFKLSNIITIENLIVTEFYGDRTSLDAKPESLLKDTSAFERIGRRLYRWRDLLMQGEAELKKGNTAFTDAELNPDDMAVILFTSGTTGTPKGVVLSHRNITVNIMDVCRIANIHPWDKTLSILPIHHTYECTLGMLLVLYRGAGTAFCEGMKYIVKNMHEAQNTVVIVVPRVLEMIHGRIMKTIKKSGKEKTFRRAVKASRNARRFGINVSRTVFKQIINELGGKLRIVITGAAALAPDICRDFEDFGIIVLQGYGMTECTPLITGTPQSSAKTRYDKSGSVGVPVETGIVRIINPDAKGVGEIIYKGPNVMLGYYNLPEETSAVLEDGWLRTGDVGYFDKDGWLFLTGRAKNVIVTKAGENIYPEEIEDYINRHPYISDSMVFASGKAEDVVAVQLLPDKDEIKYELGSVPADGELETLLKGVITELNMGLAPFKRIREVYVRKEDFVRTTTRKIKRQDNKLENLKL